MTTEDIESLVVELAQVLRTRFFGKYRGIVKKVGEGKDLGCIQANVPEVYGKDKVSPWARPVVPFAGPDYGWVVLPQKDDGVWIEFETGDISRPIWSGFWWGSDDKIPDPADKDIRVLVTPKGHKIILDDKNDELQLLHSSGSEIKMTSDEILLKNGSEIKITSDEILLKNGSSQISLKSSEVDINSGALVVK